MMNDVTEKIYIQWQKSKAQFEDPVVIKKRSVVKRLIEACYKFSNIAWGKIKKPQEVAVWEKKLSFAPPFISLLCEGVS